MTATDSARMMLGAPIRTRSTRSAVKVWSQYAPGIYEVAMNGARIGSVERVYRGEWRITKCEWTTTCIHLLPFSRRSDAVSCLSAEWARVMSR